MDRKTEEQAREGSQALDTAQALACLLAPLPVNPLSIDSSLQKPSCHLKKVMQTRMTAELLLPGEPRGLEATQCGSPGNAMGGVPQEKEEYCERWSSPAESFSGLLLSPLLTLYPPQP